VGGHVVVAFGHVREEGVAVGHQPAEERLQIALHGGIGVLLDEEAGRGVPDEDRAQALADPRRAHDAPHPARDLVQPTARGDDQRPPAAYLIHALALV
jgi:hypothetical protein